MQHLANDLRENKYGGREDGDLCNVMNAPEFEDIRKIIKDEETRQQRTAKKLAITAPMT